jgi:hypothetical protein
MQTLAITLPTRLNAENAAEVEEQLRDLDNVHHLILNFQNCGPRTDRPRCSTSSK